MNKAIARPQKAKVNDKQSNTAQQDFVLLCSLAGQDGTSLADTVHALYYLPQNYKLVVRTDAASQADVVALMDNIAIMDRIRFEQTTEEAEQPSPFSYVINNEDDTITIEAGDNRTVTVSANHPEAFASAVLKLARAQA